jgi:hypothetical protein
MNFDHEMEFNALLAAHQIRDLNGRKLPLSAIEARSHVQDGNVIPFKEDQEVLDELEKFPKWDKPSTWIITQAKNLKPGDGVRISDRTYIIAHKLRFRSKRANMLLHEVYDATSCRRIGVIDFVPAYPGYVHCQNMEAWGVPAGP